MDRANQYLAAVALAAFTFPAAATDTEDLPDCSEVAINRTSCRIEIDRKTKVTALPVRVTAKQGAPGNEVAVIVERAPFEAIKFEENHTQLAEPDVLASILGKLVDPLQALMFKEASNYGATQARNDALLTQYQRLYRVAPPVAAAEPLKNWGDVRQRLLAVHKQHEDVRETLWSWRASSREAARAAAQLAKLPWDNWDEMRVRSQVGELLHTIRRHEEQNASETPQRCGDDSVHVRDMDPSGPSPDLGYCQFPIADLQILDEQLEHVRDSWVVEPNDGTPEYAQVTQELKDAMADQAYLLAQIEEAKQTQLELRALAKVLSESAQSFDKLAIETIESTEGSAKSEVKITATNQITKSGLTLPSATILWEKHQPWELSAGLWISALEERSFSSVPVISNGQQEQIDGVPQTIVRESTSTPTVVPGVFVHYRFTETERWGRRTAFLGTAGIGANSGAAEFAIGPSWAIGNLTLSLLAHVGRDLRLTNGITVGQRNAPDISSSQEKHWVVRAAIGLSYRIPIL